MMKLNSFLYSFLLFASSANVLLANTSESIQLETTQQQFTAGETIVLIFSGTQDAAIQLYCSNSYGTTLLSPKVVEDQLEYTFPKQISSKTGIVNWKLLAKKTSLSGTFTIVPQATPTSLETYLGPPSIEAGEKDYAMLVVIPTDALDNPVQSQTQVTIQKQFLADVQQETVQTNNLIAYQRIYSPKKNGRMLLATECLGINSEEYTLHITPAIATNFDIFAKRAHEYADGNQITTFTTSIIKDKNNNVVSDGTYVEFFITNSKGSVLKTSGMTIEGVATAQMLHPDYEETWTVKAHVAGISESNSISLSYTKVMDDFAISFSKNNRTITVGPLRSFMNQRIPDGLQVTLRISQHGKTKEIYVKESRDGFVHFELNPNIFINEIYDIEITAAGITKTKKALQLW
jgi:hypothetical protein